MVSSLKILALSAAALMLMFMFLMSSHFHDETSALGIVPKVHAAVNNQVEKPELKSPSPQMEQAPEHVTVVDAIEKVKKVVSPTTEQQPPPLDLSAPVTNQKQAKVLSSHPILFLSEKEYKETSVAVLMSKYGEAEGAPQCPGDFGNKLVNRWRDQKRTICNPVADRSDNSTSSVDCYLVSQTKHHGNGDNLCVMKNVAVDLASQFDNDHITGDVIKLYVNTRHNQQPYIHFNKGFITPVYGCSGDRNAFSERFHPGWNADWTSRGLDHEKTTGALECAIWIDHPVLVNQRDTFANFFHDSEDFFNVFLGMAVLQWNFQDTQVFLTDLYPKGPFWPMWEKVFSSPSTPAMDAWDIKHKLGHTAIKNTPNGKVCFKELAVGIYGPAAPITVASWNTPCRHTALVRAYSDFVIRGLNLQGLTHYFTHPTHPSDTIVITYMARRPSSEWPEKKFCDDEHSFFVCRLWEKFGQRALGRMIKNDKEVSAALKALETTTGKGGKKVVFQDVDYNVLSFEEQIQIDLQTDIMVGPHGAGLMHNIFMRDRATLIELFVDGSSVNRHFHNLANWYGRHYDGISMSNPVNINRLVEVVQMNIDLIDINTY